MEKKLKSFATFCYRVMLNIKRKDQASNEYIYVLLDVGPLTLKVYQQQLTFLEHQLHMDENERLVEEEGKRLQKLPER